MKNLALYILRGDGPCSCGVTEKSFGGLPFKVVRVGELSEGLPYPEGTDYFCIMFCDEVISPKLLEAIPIYLENDYWDALVFLKTWDSNGIRKVSQAPRIMKRSVRVDERGIPLAGQDITFERALDGWVLDANSVNNDKAS